MNKNFRFVKGIIAFTFLVLILTGCDKCGGDTVATIKCGNATVSGLTVGVAINGVTVALRYTGGNSGKYPAGTFIVNGITASWAAGSVTKDSGSITISLSGTPTAAGTFKGSVTIGGTTCSEISITVNLPPEPIPTSVTLTYPNAAAANCVSVNGNLTFTWALGVNTTNVDVYVRQLPNGVATKVGSNVTALLLAVPTSTAATSATNLQNAQAFKWWVVAKNAGPNVTVSDSTSPGGNYKFYLSGPAKMSAVPYPADLTAPINNATAVANPINFSWVGGDADNDISYYELWFQLPGQVVFNKIGQNIPTASTTYTSVLGSGSLIKWYIKTVDLVGNSSTSDVRSFTTQ